MSDISRVENGNIGLTEEPSSAPERWSDTEGIGTEGNIHVLRDLLRKVRSSSRVLSDASNELAYTIYIGIISCCCTFH